MAIEICIRQPVEQRGVKIRLVKNPLQLKPNNAKSKDLKIIMMGRLLFTSVS